MDVHDVAEVSTTVPLEPGMNVQSNQAFTSLMNRASLKSIVSPSPPSFFLTLPRTIGGDNLTHLVKYLLGIAV